MLAAPAAAQNTFSLAVDPTGNPANGWCGVAKVSGDGLVVAYSSRATNLVPDDSNGFADIFTFERTTGRVRRVSVDSAGTQANGDSSMFLCSISSDGRFVAFTSQATNLVAGDQNGTSDAFVHDTLTGLTTCVSLTPTGRTGNDWSWIPRVSGDGRYVAFASSATDLVPGVTTSGHVYLRDLRTGTTSLISVDSTGAPGNGESDTPWISADGRFVAFDSLATNLAAADTNGDRDVFVRDLHTGRTELVSATPQGAVGAGFSGNPSLSADGRFVSFVSRAADLVPGDLNGKSDIFVRDLATRRTELATVTSSGEQANEHCLGNSMLSADGSVVVFDSYATNLAHNDVQGELDVFVRDRAAGTTALVSAGYAGTSLPGASADPSVTQDGRYIVFSSRSSDIVQGHNNFDWDPYFHDRLGSTPLVVSYCAQGATTSDGCRPRLTATGVPSGARSGFTLAVDGAPAQRLALLFYGVAGAREITYGAGPGRLCVQVPVQRMRPQSTAGTPGLCDGHLAADWNGFVADHPTALGAPFLGGRTVWAQAWIRDPGATSGAALTDAVWFTVCP